MRCDCGGIDEADHLLGTDECLREKVKTIPRKIKHERDKFFVDGHTVTGYSLREQRGYAQHVCGGWSKPKDMGSRNSLQ